MPRPIEVSGPSGPCLVVAKVAILCGAIINRRDVCVVYVEGDLTAWHGPSEVVSRPAAADIREETLILQHHVDSASLLNCLITD